MSEENLNVKEEALIKIYNEWEIGKAYEQNPNFSPMFRMGYPTDFLENEKPLIMYVGQECLRCNEEKSQVWVRGYQEEEIHKNKDHRPFWIFYLDLYKMGYNVIWNNLNKFHLANTTYLDEDSAVILNKSYGTDNLSIIQREIIETQPTAIVFAIGNKQRYIKSLAASFSKSEDVLSPYRPTKEQPINEISAVLGLKNKKVFWCYHPAYLNRSKNYEKAIQFIKEMV